MKKQAACIAFSTLIYLACSPPAFAQTALGTEFTYQGRLVLNGEPVNGDADFWCSLWDAEEGGNQVGPAAGWADVYVDDGLFSIPLDFGSNFFTGEERWLQIRVASPSGTSPTLLTPRQKLTPTPYAHTAVEALTARNAWNMAGNAGTDPQDDFLGTTDAAPLTFKANDARALQLEYSVHGVASGQNVIGGYWQNSITENVVGGTVFGGQAYGAENWPNIVTDHLGTVSGGCRNQAGDDDTDLYNSQYATVGGGFYNTASGSASFIGGGYQNTASGEVSAVQGGLQNVAEGDGAVVGGGRFNIASGDNSCVPGGVGNIAAENYSMAAGHSAHANHTGVFIWGDSNPEPFESTNHDQFLIRATSGVGINRNDPGSELDVNGIVTATAFIGDGSMLTNLPSAETPWMESADDLYYSAGRVGIGTESPEATLHVRGDTFIAPVDEVDQANEATSDGVLFASDPQQSFTAELDGLLTRVDIRFHSSTTSTSATLTINEGVGSGGATLVTQSFPITPNTDYWAAILIADEVIIEAGMPYTIKLVSTDGSMRIADSHGDAYPGGAALGFADGVDMLFRTFVGEKSTITAGAFVGDGSGLTNLPIADPLWEEGSESIYFNEGNVGIGTMFPSGRLHVSEDDNPEITFENVGDNTADRDVSIYFRHDLGFGASINAVRRSGDNQGMDLEFYTQSDEAVLNRHMVITPAGKVGIGTDPTYPLHMKSATDARMAVQSPTNNWSGYLSMNSQRNYFMGLAGGTSASNWHVYDNTAAAERIVILPSGNVGIARTPSSNKLELEGNASKSTAGDWLANSDRRIKKHIQTIGDALGTLDRVRLVSFEYTDDYKASHDGVGDGRYLNVIAQEFAEVFPDHVQGSGEFLPDGSEILQVDTYPLTIYSAAAIQELHGEMLAKDIEIAALKDANQALADRLARLETVIESLNSK